MLLSYWEMSRLLRYNATGGIVRLPDATIKFNCFIALSCCTHVYLASALNVSEMEPSCITIVLNNLIDAVVNPFLNESHLSLLMISVLDYCL